MSCSFIYVFLCIILIIFNLHTNKLTYRLKQRYRKYCSSTFLRYFVIFVFKTWNLMLYLFLLFVRLQQGEEINVAIKICKVDSEADKRKSDARREKFLEEACKCRYSPTHYVMN